MMDAFASVISNNLNDVMKILSVITIVNEYSYDCFQLAYGMNLNAAGMPFSGTQWGIPDRYSDIHSTQCDRRNCAVKKKYF